MKEKDKLWKYNYKTIVLILFIFIISGCQPYASLNSGVNNNNNDDKLLVHYIDVGQGDATFIELPNDESMLIDAGESEYSNVVNNYIRALGYDEIDYIIGTHPHSDHIGGLEDIINNYDIGKIYLPKASSNTKTYLGLLQSIKDKDLIIDTGKSGINVINEEDLKIDLIGPVNDKYDDLNNYSIVTKLQYKDVSFLFMGDAEKLSENEIIDYVKKDGKINLKSDVIKVGHHGSGTSSGSSFLKMVRPKYAVISVGNDNKYGHPHKNILEDYKKIGANIYRTDKVGTIVISSDGKNISVNNEPESISEDENKIKLISLPEDVIRGNDITIEITGEPNTEYDIDVIYKSGVSKAKGLENKYSDADGKVSWTFKVGNTVIPGTYKIIVRDGSDEEEFEFNVLEG